MLEVQDISVHYRGVLALEPITFILASGELVGLIGPNGAGKSTLLKAMLGLVPTTTGHVLFEGMPLRRQRQRVAYVPQRSQIDWDYPITAWNVVMMARTVATGWFRCPSAVARQMVRSALEQVEMLELCHRQIGQLSGGQQQRVFLARALAQQADLFFLDEPFAGIDKKTETIMLDVFADLQAQGKVIVVCSHEWGTALQRYDRLLLLNRRLIANDTPSVVMTFENIQQAYGESLQSSLNGRVETPFLS
jgi:manganese/iron transport system ATP-binding protein